MTAPLGLFNSLTREIETFHPIHPGEVVWRDDRRRLAGLFETKR